MWYLLHGLLVGVGTCTTKNDEGQALPAGQTMRFLAKSPDMNIIDEGRLSRRTVADAVEILRSQPNFSQNVRSTIKTGPLHLPSGDVPFLIILECKELGLAVTLPTSMRFRATLVHSPTTSKVEEDIPLLDGAVVELIEGQAHVVLPDGRCLRNPVSTAAKQKHQYNDNQDQIHGNLR